MESPPLVLVRRIHWTAMRDERRPAAWPEATNPRRQPPVTPGQGIERRVSRPSPVRQGTRPLSLLRLCACRVGSVRFFAWSTSNQGGTTGCITIQSSPPRQSSGRAFCYYESPRIFEEPEKLLVRGSKGRPPLWGGWGLPILLPLPPRRRRGGKKKEEEWGHPTPRQRATALCTPAGRTRGSHLFKL